MIGLRIYPSGGAGTSPFTVTLSPDSIFDDQMSPTDATGSSTGTAVGGTAPYTYAWTLVTGTVTSVVITGTSTATVNFSLSPVGTRTFVYRLTVTDNNGATAVADLSVFLEVV